jgi:hypothetical protein
VRDAALGALVGGLGAVASFGLLLLDVVLLDSVYTPNGHTPRLMVATCGAAVILALGCTLETIVIRAVRRRWGLNWLVMMSAALAVSGFALIPWLVTLSAVNDCRLGVDFPLTIVHACER